MCVGELAQVLLDLRRQLARGREDERARDAARLADEAVHDRQQKGGSLAAARHRAREYIAALECGRNCVVLNRCWACEAKLFHAAHESSVETECGEGHHGSLTEPRDR